MNLKDQFYITYIKNGLAKLLSEMQSKYQIKKGERFSVEGLTYEIGLPKICANDCVEFEISSKIPQDELKGVDQLSTYFDKVKKEVSSTEKPLAIEMENIIRNINSDEEKKRDYVKLKFQYTISQLFNDSDIRKKMEEFKKDPSKKDSIPHIGGISTMAGKLVLLCVEESIYSLTKTSLSNLINANHKIRSEMKQAKE